MAQEKDRAVRARKTTEGESGAAATGKGSRMAPHEGAMPKTPAAKQRGAKTPTAKKQAAKAAAGAEAAKASAAKKAAPKRTTTKATTAVRAKAPARTRRALTAVAEPTREEIAERAYLLWEAGEPGDQTEHWLRAEAELRTAA